MAELLDRFDHVAFVPGNHELWVKGSGEDFKQRNEGATDSLEKLEVVLRACDEMGVHTRPHKIGCFWLVPLLSWHHKSFDTEPDIPGIPVVSPWVISVRPLFADMHTSHPYVQDVETLEAHFISNVPPIVTRHITISNGLLLESMAHFKSC